VIAPLGTANVYTATTSRILLGLVKDFFPQSFLNKLNKFSSPKNCLWVNAGIGACFLLPFPTWSQLVDFLSSIVVFSYLAGPITLIVLRQKMPNLQRPFKVFAYKIVGYAGFVCCSLLIYWSNINNLIYLTLLVTALIAVHNLFVEEKSVNLFSTFKNNFFVPSYLLALLAIKYLNQEELISFPIDNLLVIAISCFACKIFIANSISKKEIENNLKRVVSEDKN
jgi:amino acid transporter